MKIYLDVSTLSPDQFTGVGVYTAHLFWHLQKMANVIPFVKISRFKKRNAIQNFLHAKVEIHTPLHDLILTNHDVVLGPDFRMRNYLRARKVVMIHDMVVFEGKYNEAKFSQDGQSQLRAMLRNSQPDAVLANSEFCKSEILKYFPELKDRTFVTPLGCDYKLPQKLLPIPEQIKAPYFLYLATIEKRKNVAAIVNAFEVYAQAGGQSSLVLAGKIGYQGQEVLELIARSQYSSRIHYLSYVDEDLRASLMSNCKALVFPSFYEGFGLPVVEALKVGTPVIISPAPALLEVARGAAAVVTKDFTAQSIYEALSEFEARNMSRASLSEYGKKQVEKFNWDYCAELTLDVCRKTLSQERLL